MSTRVTYSSRHGRASVDPADDVVSGRRSPDLRVAVSHAGPQGPRQNGGVARLALVRCLSRRVRMTHEPPVPGIIDPLRGREGIAAGSSFPANARA